MRLQGIFRRRETRIVDRDMAALAAINTRCAPKARHDGLLDLWDGPSSEPRSAGVFACAIACVK